MMGSFTESVIFRFPRTIPECTPLQCILEFLSTLAPMRRQSAPFPFVIPAAGFRTKNVSFWIHDKQIKRHAIPQNNNTFSSDLFRHELQYRCIEYVQNHRTTYDSQICKQMTHSTVCRQTNLSPGNVQYCETA